MKTRNAAIAVALLLASVPATADAGLVIDVFQSGGDVVATASGSLDLADLTYSFSSDVNPSVNPRIATLIIGPPGGGPVDIYTGFSGPKNFGSHVITHPSNATGDIIGLEGGLGNIVVPAGYVSGSALAGSMTFDDTTIAGMGMIPGTYTWTWGSGADADSLTVNIGSGGCPACSWNVRRSSPTFSRHAGLVSSPLLPDKGFWRLWVRRHAMSSTISVAGIGSGRLVRTRFDDYSRVNSGQCLNLALGDIVGGGDVGDMDRIVGPKDDPARGEGGVVAAALDGRRDARDLGHARPVRGGLSASHWTR